MATPRGSILDAAGILRQLVADGGLLTATPLAPGAQPAIRSLIQADGNVVVILHPDAIHDPAFRAALSSHWDTVRDRISIIPRATTRLRTVGNVLGGVSFAGSLVLAVAKNRQALVALAVSAAFFVAARAGRFVLRLAIRAGLGGLAGSGGTEPPPG